MERSPNQGLSPASSRASRLHERRSIEPPSRLIANRSTLAPIQYLANRARGGLLATLTAVGAACVLAPATALAGTLDQQQVDGDGGGVFVDSAHSIGQTFTAGFGGGLDQVDLNLQKLLGSTPTAYLSVELRDVSGGTPGGMILASKSLPASAIPTFPLFVPVNFSPPAPVVAGGHYAVVAYSATPPGNGWGWSFGLTANPYAGGDPFSTPNAPPSGAWMSGTRDLAFKTYVVPAPGPTGQRAAALKKCKKKHGHKRKKCKKKANLLPV